MIYVIHFIKRSNSDIRLLNKIGRFSCRQFVISSYNSNEFDFSVVVNRVIRNLNLIQIVALASFTNRNPSLIFLSTNIYETICYYWSIFWTIQNIILFGILSLSWNRSIGILSQRDYGWRIPKWVSLKQNYVCINMLLL
jgi:hypothetical protein